MGKIDYRNGSAALGNNESQQNVQLNLIYSFGSQFGKNKEYQNRAVYFTKLTMSNFSSKYKKSFFIRRV